VTDVPEDRVAVPGSAPARPGTVRALRAADPGERVEVTLVVRRAEQDAAQAEALLAGRAAVRPRDDAEARLRSTDADIQCVEAFADRFGLRVVRASPEAHVVQVEGSVSQAEAAFGVRMDHVEENGVTYRSHQGEVSLPRTVAGIITAVLGLDDRPAARPPRATD
jgi:kumamolisin